MQFPIENWSLSFKNEAIGSNVLGGYRINDEYSPGLGWNNNPFCLQGLLELWTPSTLKPPEGVTYTALEATKGQMDGSLNQLPYRCYLEEVASVGD